MLESSCVAFRATFDFNRRTISQLLPKSTNHCRELKEEPEKTESILAGGKEANQSIFLQAGSNKLQKEYAVHSEYHGNV